MRILVTLAATALAAGPAFAGLVPAPPPIEVPEPGALGLLAVGTITAAIIARRRK